MKTLFKVAIIGIALAISGCSQGVTSTTVTDLPTVAPNLPEPPQLGQVQWKVYDANDLKQLSSSNPNIVLFTMTQEQNRILDDNIVELQRYISQLQQAIVYYQKQSAPAQK